MSVFDKAFQFNEEARELLETKEKQVIKKQVRNQTQGAFKKRFRTVTINDDTQSQQVKLGGPSPHKRNNVTKFVRKEEPKVLKKEFKTSNIDFKDIQATADDFEEKFPKKNGFLAPEKQKVV